MVKLLFTGLVQQTRNNGTELSKVQLKLNRGFIGRLFSGSVRDSRISLAIFSLLAFALIIDTILFRISDLNRIYSSPTWTLPVFVSIAITFLIGSQVILNFAKSKRIEDKVIRYRQLRTLRYIIPAIQYMLAGIIITILVEMILYKFYHTSLISFAAMLSYCTAIVMIAFLAQRFRRWFRLNRSTLILLYFLSSLVLVVNAIATLGLIAVLSTGFPIHVGESQIASLTRPIASNYTTMYLYQLSGVTAVTSFVLMWGATGLLLRQHVKKFGKMWYWIIMAAPLIYFLSQFPALILKVFNPLLISDPMFYGTVLTLFFTLSKPAGGIIFGLGFWMLSRRFTADTAIRTYLVIAAQGVILLFISNQGGFVLIQSGALYPPFGLATLSMLGLSSYLLLIGISSSAISVSQDASIRKTIKKSLESLDLLDRIGTAEMEREIESRVISMTKSHAQALAEESGIEPSLTDDEMREYIDDVLVELKKKPGRRYD